MFSKTVRVFRILRSSKISFQILKHREIVQVHLDGHELLTKFVEPQHIAIADPARLNFWILLRCLVSLNITMASYNRVFIKKLSPKLVITFIDNDPGFYLLKQYFTKPKYVAVQNGLRHNYSYSRNNGFVDQLKSANKNAKLSADLICTFGKNSSLLFEQFINAESLVTGNIKNNEFDLALTNKFDFDIIFMSQHAPFELTTSTETVHLNNQSTSIINFYQVEADVARLLAEYCNQHSLRFAVSGKRDHKDHFEADFFKQAIGELPYTFLPRIESNSSYKNATRSSLIVVIDSTIGYELLSRGLKVAFFSARVIGPPHERSLSKDTCFGFPGTYPDTGPFWTNLPNTPEFNQILDSLLTCSEPDWTALTQPYTEDLMAFRPGSPEFVQMLQNFGVSLKSEVISRA